MEWRLSEAKARGHDAVEATEVLPFRRFQRSVMRLIPGVATTERIRRQFNVWHYRKSLKSFQNYLAPGRAAFNHRMHLAQVLRVDRRHDIRDSRANVAGVHVRCHVRE